MTNCTLAIGQVGENGQTYCNEDGNPSGTVDALVPEPDDEGTGYDLIRTDDEVFAEIDESSSETESGVNTSSSVSSETLLGGESSRHFSQSQHDGETAECQRFPLKTNEHELTQLPSRRRR
jgi:hypothetical protein